jgi:hypothetical protein
VIGEVSADKVVTCAGVGNRVDRRRTRDSVFAAVAKTGSLLLLCDDFPYLAWPDVNVMPALPAHVRVWEPMAFAVSDVNWAIKLRAVAPTRARSRCWRAGGQAISD